MEKMKIKYEVRLCSFNILNYSDNFVNSKLANTQIIEIGEILNKNLEIKRINSMKKVSMKIDLS